MKITARDFIDNPDLTPLEILDKIEKEKWKNIKTVDREAERKREIKQEKFINEQVSDDAICSGDEKI